MKCLLPMPLLLPLLCLLAGCVDKKAPVPIVTTTGMVGDMMRSVAGDGIAVKNIISASSDPHLFAPKIEHIRAMQQAEVLAYSGLHLEGKMAKTIADLEKQGKRVLALAEALPEDLLLREGEGEKTFDPHVWMSPVLWKESAAIVETTLSTWRPEQAELFATNRVAVEAQLDELHTYVQGVIAKIPEDRRILVTAHDAFAYFGAAYGLQVEGIQGISTDDEAGLTRIRDLVDILVEKKIPAVFAETTVPSDNITSLQEGAASRGHTVEVCPLPLFSDAMGAAGTYEGTYIGMIDHNATVIARALGGPDAAPERGMSGRLMMEDSH